jgi:hypothetical protein
MNKPFVFIVGDWVSGHWFWTIVSTICHPEAKMPGHVRFGMGEDMDEVLTAFTKDYISNTDYFASRYTKAVTAQPSRFGLTAGAVIDELAIYKALIEDCFRLVILYGRENYPVRLSGSIMFADRNGITFGDDNQTFDTKDFFLPPTTFKKMYPAQYFMK